MASDSDHPFAPVVELWLSLMKKARDHKWRAFGKTADECWKFFDGAHDFMYQSTEDSSGLSAIDAPKTTFRMTLNKVAEAVQLFGPTLYYKNPHRQVNRRKPEVPQMALGMMVDQQVQAQMQQMLMMGGGPGMVDPMLMQQMQQQMAQQVMMGYQSELAQGDARHEAVSILSQTILNFTPNEFDLKGESRLAIDEAIIKGRGVVFHEMFAAPGSNTWLPKTSWLSVDDVLIDPDAKTLRGATWIAIRCQEPYWQVERDRGMEPGSMKKAATGESASRSAEVDSGKFGSHYRRRGDSHDLVTYYKVFSKAGMGHRLAKGSLDSGFIGSSVEPLKEMLEQFGDYCYIEVCDGCNYPLNLPNNVLDAPAEEEGAMEDFTRRVSWPVPFYRDNEWPITELDFHPIPGSAWPQAHMKPALGELRFLNWAMSFLAGRIRTTSRTFIALAEHLDEEIKDAIENGGDLTILPLKTSLHKSINEVVQFLDHPGVNKDIWDIISQVMILFDKRTGLTELLYGLSGKQMRSAQEAALKEEQTNIRPDDMAAQVETWQTRIARKEGQMLRLFCGPESVAPVFGETVEQPPEMPGMPPQQPQLGVFSQMWAQFAYAPVEGGDQNVEKVFREYEYRIEAGSIRKPNVERDQTNMDQAMQVLLQPLLNAYNATGDPTQVNAFISDWAKTRQLDATPYLFQPIQMMPPPAPDQQQPPEQGAA